MEEECPKCGNKNLNIYRQIAVGQTVSARTGKVLKDHGMLETTCWNYLCKCGWVGDLQVPQRSTTMKQNGYEIIEEDKYVINLDDAKDQIKDWAQYRLTHSQIARNCIQVLNELDAAKQENERLLKALDRIGFYCAGTELQNVSEFVLRVKNGEQVLT